MKIYRKIIHPYRYINSKKEHIEGYEGKWFSEETLPALINEIYIKFAEPSENKVRFVKRFSLRWEKRYVSLSFTSDMDYKSKDIIDDIEQEF